MNEFSKRLITLADHFRVSTPAAFAKKVGISHQSATNYLKGSRMPTLDVLLKIQGSFEGLNIEWLLTGKEEMLKSPDTEFDSVKNLEIHYLKKSNSDKDEIIESQKIVIRVLSEKSGIDLTEITPVEKQEKGKKGGIIKGFGSSYQYFGMLIPN